MKIYQKIHSKDNRIRRRYLLFHWHDFEVSKTNHSLFTFNLKSLFIIQLPPPKVDYQC